MSFIWPPMLLTVALVPIGALLYWALDKRRHRLLATRGGMGSGREPPAGRQACAAGLLRC